MAYLAFVKLVNSIDRSISLLNNESVRVLSNYMIYLHARINAISDSNSVWEWAVPIIFTAITILLLLVVLIYYFNHKRFHNAVDKAEEAAKKALSLRDNLAYYLADKVADWPIYVDKREYSYISGVGIINIYRLSHFLSSVEVLEGLGGTADAKTNFFAGVACVLENNDIDAIVYFEKAFKKNNTFFECLFYLEDCYRRVYEYENALRVVCKNIRLDKNEVIKRELNYLYYMENYNEVKNKSLKYLKDKKNLSVGAINSVYYHMYASMIRSLLSSYVDKGTKTLNLLELDKYKGKLVAYVNEFVEKRGKQLSMSVFHIFDNYEELLLELPEIKEHMS